MLKFNKQAKYDLIAPTSMGLRFTPTNREPIHTSQLFRIQATSAESNVLAVSASLGLKTKVLTAFVKDSHLSQYIKNDLSRRHIEIESNDKDKGGPWGYRHQINIADQGFGHRAPVVENDRSGEVGKTLNIKDFNIKKLFDEEGVKCLHLSGLIASISKETSAFCIELVKAAKSSGTIISFDLNYRASFWKNRADDLHDTFHTIATMSDIIIGNEEDFQLALNINGPSIKDNHLSIKIDAYKSMINSVKSKYPQLSIVGTTLRAVKSANQHLWGCIVHHQNEWQIIEPKPIDVQDRIGGGDGFVGGLLYALLTKHTLKASTEFAWATGAYTVSVLDDYAMPLSENQIWRVWHENARIIR